MIVLTALSQTPWQVWRGTLPFHPYMPPAPPPPTQKKKKNFKLHLSIRYAICSGTREQSMQVWMQVHLSSIKNTVCRSPEPLIIAARTKFDQTYFYFVTLAVSFLLKATHPCAFKQVLVPVKLPPKRGKV